MSKQKARTPALKPGAPRHKDTAKTSPDASRGALAPDANGHLAAKSNGGVFSADRSAEIAEKIKELVRLAQEQGYLTYNDVNEALPDTMITGEALDEVYVKLRNLEVEIVDQAEVDRS